ncbi:hypothetical protein GCM10009860_25680 [Microbacterium mitrae]|uniref:DUF4878 domain-containing protein n=1 Tax=Microbacterium mitrae TaxID=664640 RepID=A0A5C8HJU6_9MICO|nr:DUF4878 domain-containing protein [Microbacterium mitrae]TXK02758.1 DUF4878 domain-containing protein [Microbacterium mitrae]
MKRKLMALGAVAALSLSLAACSGGGVGGGEEAKVADRFTQFFDGLIAGDGEATCDVMLVDATTPMKDDATTYDLCVSTYEGLGDTMKEAMKDSGVEKIEVTKVEIDGDTATVTAKGAGALGGEESLTMTKVDGDWYLSQDSFAG